VWDLSHIATNEIKTLTAILVSINKLSVAIQSDSRNLASVRLIFDSKFDTFFLFDMYPEFVQYLAPDARIVKDPHFETALCKLQNNLEHQLTVAEAEAISHLKVDIVDLEEVLSAPEEDSFDDSSGGEQIVQKKSGSVQILLPSCSNKYIVERFFSVAIIKCDNRKPMLPENLNRLLFRYKGVSKQRKRV
jgi:hypothetical protein